MHPASTRPWDPDAMDSCQRMIDGLPARVPPGRSGRASAKHVREVVAHLPMVNPPQAVDQVRQVLDDLLATLWDGAERVAALECLRVPVEGLCAGVERQPAGGAGPGALAVPAAVAQELQARLMLGYAVALAELCGPTGRPPRFKGVLAATAVVRALAHAERVLASAWRRYEAPPAGLWLRAHALYAFACELMLSEQAVGDPLGDGVAQTAGTAYAHLLLLALSDPYRLAPAELEEARAVTRCAAAFCAIGPARTHGLHVDPARDAGPVRAGEDGAPLAEGTLAIALAPIEQIFDACLAAVPARVDAVELPRAGAGPLTTSRRFLARLRAAWGIAQRGHARMEAKHSLELVVGMYALHRALAGGLDFDDFVGRIRGDVAVAGGDAAEARRPRPTVDVQPLRGEVLDQGEGGYRLRVRDASSLCIGRIVGLAPVGDEAGRDWMVGVVRWIRRQDGGDTTGIELLRREARAAGLQPVAADGAPLAPVRAVELPGDHGAETLSLLVTDGLARDVETAELSLAALASDWASRSSVATWRVGRRETLAPACFCVTLEREAATAGC